MYILTCMNDVNIVGFSLKIWHMVSKLEKSGCQNLPTIQRGEEGQTQLYLVRATSKSLSLDCYVFKCPTLEENNFFYLVSLGHKNIIMEGRGFWRWLGQDNEVIVAWTRNYCSWPSSPLPTIQRSKHPILGLDQKETFLI